MAAKNLAIREDVYRKLAEAKREGESFGEVIERLLERRYSLLSLWGRLADSKNMGEVEYDIRDIRKKTVIRTR